MMPARGWLAMAGLAAILACAAAQTTTPFPASNDGNWTEPGANATAAEVCQIRADNRANGRRFADTCNGLLFDYWGDMDKYYSNEPEGGIFVAYLIVLVYFFGGVAVAADIFMGAIEAMTAVTREVEIGTGAYTRTVEVMVWNKTVSNLSLMALGSSAPEILFAVIEVVGGGFQAGDLGPGTIVGSAAFNMLMIIAICVTITPLKRVEEIIVLHITAFASVFAYVWLYIIVSVTSPYEIEVWEGVVTCILFPVLVAIAWFADLGWFDADQCMNGATKVKRRVTGGVLPKSHDRQAVEYLVQVGHMNTHAQGTAMWRRDLRRACVEIKKKNPEMPMDEVYVRAFEQHTTHPHAPKLHPARQPKRKVSRSPSSDAQDVLSLTPPAETTDGIEMADMRLEESNVDAPGRSASYAAAHDDADGGVEVECVEIGFEQYVYQVDEANVVASIPVGRFGRFDEAVEVRWKTFAGTAKEGVNFVANEGTITFAPTDGASGEAQHEAIEIGLIDDKVYAPHLKFTVALACSSPHVEWTVRTVRVELIDSYKFKGAWDEISRSCGSNWKAIFGDEEVTHNGWIEQIRESIQFDDDDEDEEGGDEGDVTPDDEFPEEGDGEDEPRSKWDWFVYLFLIVPKVTMGVLCPPVSLWHGLATFWVSLGWIGLMTAICGDLASGMGCTVGLLDAVTAITFVALGTSVPDTFASKIAAESDDTADAAIGNVTGSNAVNVFLGIGLSWLIGAGEQGSRGNAFTVCSGSLGFSVVLFVVMAAVWYAVLMYRRTQIGGELGGPVRAKKITSMFFVGMWFLFILLSALVEYGTISVPF